MHLVLPAVVINRALFVFSHNGKNEKKALLITTSGATSAVTDSQMHPIQWLDAANFVGCRFSRIFLL